MKPFCYAPFVHMYVHNRKFSKLCCVSEEPEIEVLSENLKDRWESSYYTTIRQQFINGISSPYCRRCIENEEAGLHSDRIMFSEMYGDLYDILNIKTGTDYGSPIDLDIRESNLCNLKCRMCSPSSSSQLEREVSEHSEIRDIQSLPIKLPTTMTNEDNVSFLLSNINRGKRIKLLGGEPTIMPEVHKMLDDLTSNKIFDVPLFITTNVTNTNQTFIDKISRFENVHYTFSLDGIGSVVEYIRSPIKWKTAEDNMKVYAKNAASSSITYTVQAYNLLHLREFIEWFSKNDLNISLRFEVLTTPSWASYRSIPNNIRQKYLSILLEDDIITDDIIQKSPSLIPMIERCLSDETEYDIFNFVNVTKRYDKVRKQHIKDYIPEVWDFIKKDYDDLQI